jgi:hypothetical protein
MLIDWTDSCIRRGVKKRTVFISWPILGGGGMQVISTKPCGGRRAASVVMAGEILKTLRSRKIAKNPELRGLAEQTFRKFARLLAGSETAGSRSRRF